MNFQNAKNYLARSTESHPGSLEASEQPHQSGSSKNIALSNMKKRTEELMQTVWFKTEI
jgi:hypothetical protein